MVGSFYFNPRAKPHNAIFLAAAVSLRDGWVPSMSSQMGVSASGQYVCLGLDSIHFSPVMDLPWTMSVRRDTSSGEKFHV